MIVICAHRHRGNIDAIIQRLVQLRALIRGEERTIIGVVGAAHPAGRSALRACETARITRPISSPPASSPHDTVVDVRGVKVGDGSCVVIAGRAVERGADKYPRAAREAGANMLRGGAFKPRSSPYTFRMGEEARS